MALTPLVALVILAQVEFGSLWTWVAAVVIVVAATIAFRRLALGREGQAFPALGVVVAAAVVSLFGALYPNVLPSTLDSDFSLTVEATASSPYTLEVISWLALFGLPAVLAYQGWTYWVFRERVSTAHIPPVHVP